MKNLRTCDNCRFLQHEPTSRIYEIPGSDEFHVATRRVCYRYPEAVYVSPGYWCGEFQSNAQEITNGLDRV